MSPVFASIDKDSITRQHASSLSYLYGTHQSIGPQHFASVLSMMLSGHCGVAHPYGNVCLITLTTNTFMINRSPAPVPTSSDVPSHQTVLVLKLSCYIQPQVIRSSQNFAVLIQDHHQKNSLYSFSVQHLGPDLDVHPHHPQQVFLFFASNFALSLISKPFS